MPLKTNTLSRIKSSFTAERSICRGIASWCSFCARQLIKDKAFFELRYIQDFPIGKMCCIISLFFILYSVVNLFYPQYETDSWFLISGASICVFRWLFSYDNTQNKFFFALAVIAAYSLFALYGIHKNNELLKKWNPNKTVWIFTALCGIFCGYMIAAVTCYRYLTFTAPNFDFGLFVNMFHNMRKTGLPLVTCERDVLLSHFAIHISPVYYLLLPFYMIFPSPLTLQIGQAVVVASGVIPTVLLCKHYRLSGKSACALTLIYALHPVLSTGCFFDLHENCFLAPLLLWMFYFFERQKYIPMYVFAALTVCVKEDAAVYIAIFALYLLLARKKISHGVILLVGALAYFTVAMSLLQSASEFYADFYRDQSPNPTITGPMINRFDNLIYQKDEGLVGALKTVLVNPGYLLTQLFTTPQNGWEKFTYFLQMLLPFAILPFCSNKPSRLILISPILLNLLTNYSYQYNIGFQYHFGIIAFLTYASIVNLSEMRENLRRNLLTFAVIACVCLYTVCVFPSFRSYQKMYENGKETYVQMEEILDTIPSDASVSCSWSLLSHIADRDEIYEIFYHGNVGDTDYIVLDIRGGVDRQQVNAFVRQGYRVEQEYEGLILILVK